MKRILETKHLTIREMDADNDAAFVFELLNTPKFIKFIGDRGVRSEKEAAEFIENKYRQSYRDLGYGLYTVCLKKTGDQIGVCGFVKRDTLPDTDIGFAFLPEYEGQGYGFESANAVLEYGRNKLGLLRILAITSPDNDASGNLLEKMGFKFDGMVEISDEPVKLFSIGNQKA